MATIQQPIKGNAVPVFDPVVLTRCSKGISKHIKLAKTPDERKRLRMIKSEIDFLIENL